jgi:hypothetical protein
LFVCIISTVVLVAACRPGDPIDVGGNPPDDAGPFSLSGYVLKGPVSGATVTAYKLDGDLSAGDALAR